MAARVLIELRDFVRFRLLLQAVIFASAALAISLTAWMTQAGMWQLRDNARYVCYFAVASLATRLRVRSTTSGDTCSMSFIFVLIAMVELNALESILIASCAILLDCISRRGEAEKLLDAISNLTSTVAATLAAQWAYHGTMLGSLPLEWPVRFVAASMFCFVAGNLPLVVAARSDGANPRRLLQSLYLFSFPYYVVAATVTAIYAAVQPFVQWYVTAMLVPMIVLLHRSFEQYSRRLDREKARGTATLALQDRTMEALALAMEKDQASQLHLRRMQVYAEGIGKELGMPDAEREALRAAAVLHDIGKLAVPDHITSNPGRLNAEEFEKMKTHTLIGAGIVEQARFPYGVAPLVRWHHERWDGTGYPDGLKGEGIPLGARILAVVDCLEALTTERSYRQAIALEQAVTYIASAKGTAFDPKVTAVLEKRYQAFEQTLADKHPEALDRGPAPYLQSISAARNETIGLFQMHEQLSQSLNQSDIGQALRSSFRSLVPYDALAVYFEDAPDTRPDLVCGDRSVMRRRPPKAVLKLPFSKGPDGRIEFYFLLADGFTAERERLVRGLLPRIGQAVENARRFAATKDSATTDFLTRLPNMASLAARLKDDLESAAKSKSEVVVLVCDLDGFKQVNDKLGHLTGNRVLQEVAQALTANTRGADYVARMGGDEFVMLMPGNAPTRIEERTIELRQLIREAGQRACGADMIDASFGAARYPNDGADADDLVSAADQRMYEEKARRKNTRPASSTPDAGLQMTAAEPERV